MIAGRSEEADLLSQIIRIHRCLAEEPLQLSRARGRVSREVVVHVAVHGGRLLDEHEQRLRPLLELARAVELQPRVVDDVAVGSHPPVSYTHLTLPTNREV